mmetsp:Transcript_86130/g.257021  ORF Transcript_86130/g.257021 Transcript_86130/m.257021 type:complete len:114 (+) Transcript_86130:541-882(+)
MCSVTGADLEEEDHGPFGPTLLLVQGAQSGRSGCCRNEPHSGTSSAASDCVVSSAAKRREAARSAAAPDAGCAEELTMAATEGRGETGPTLDSLAASSEGSALRTHLLQPRSS